MLDIFVSGFSAYIIHRCVLFASHAHIPLWFPKWRRLALTIGITLIAGGSLAMFLLMHKEGAVLLATGIGLYFLSDSRKCVSYRCKK